MTIETPLRDQPAIDRLTPGQRECLLLVAQLQSSKQIARKLGISPYTVDQRVARACRTLGASTRNEAALMVADHVARNGLETVSDAVALDPVPQPAPAFPQLASGVRSEPEPQVVDRGADITGNEEERTNLPFPTRAHPGNDMSFMRRLGWATMIAAAAVVVAGMLLTSLAALKSLG